MKIGLQLRSRGPWSEVEPVARAVDRLRFDSLWACDHLLPMGKGVPENVPTLEAWTLLSALAVVTGRVRLGCLVSAVTFRHPAVMAKMAATVDEISGGRLELGIGAAWHAREHEAFGVPFPATRERLDMLEECAQVARRLFHAETPVTFDGRFTRLAAAPPLRPIPIMVGGGGERRTLRIVAQWADAMNVHGSPPEAARKISIMERHCADVGRDPRVIRRTVSTWFELADSRDEAIERARSVGFDVDDAEELRWLPIATADDAIRLLRAYADHGVDEVILQMPAPTPAILERIDAQVLVPLRP